MGFFYRIFLSRTIGASGLGLYQLIFPIFSLCIAISVSGIQTAISRFVASEEHGSKYLYTGLLLSTSLSALFSIGIYVLSPWIATFILKEERVCELLQAMVFAIPPACIHACFNGYYYGRKKSTIPSACQIIEQVARILGTIIIYMVLLDQGLPLQPIHAVWGLVISEVAGLIFNLTAYAGWEMKDTHLTLDALKPLSLLALPLTLNHVLMTLSHSLENLLLPQQLVLFGYSSDEALSHFGILSGMALSVIFFPSAITNSLSVLLLPRISEIKAKGDKSVVLETIKGAVCCGVVLGSLCTFVFLLSADWFGEFIFDNSLAGFYIRTLSILCPFMYTSGLLSSIVNGWGDVSLTLACNLTGCAIRIFSIWFLVPIYGMYAYILSLILGAMVVTAELMVVVKKRCSF